VVGGTAKIHTETIVGFHWDHPRAKKPRDKHNVYHMLDRHNVTPNEVEEVVEGAPVFIGTGETDGDSPVYGVVGITANGRMLEVWGMVFQKAPLAGMWRTITAMDADEDARRRYYKERGVRQ
jgi:hypothetical protein